MTTRVLIWITCATSVLPPFRRDPVPVVGPLLVAALAVWAGCDLVGTGESNPTISLSLTDVPASNIEEARIQIETIYLERDRSSGRDTLLHESVGMIDLMALSEDPLELVEDETVAPGTYDQLRMVLGTVELRTGGDSYSVEAPNNLDRKGGSLQCPSCPEEGIKIPLPRPGLMLEQETGTHTSLVVEFDVSQSFERQPGQPDTWIMHPVTSAAVADVSGSIDGEVRLDSDAAFPETCGDVRPSVRDFTPLLQSVETDSVLKSARVERDGTFSMDYIPPVVHRASYEELVAIGDPDSAVAFKATVEPEKPYIQSGDTTRVEIDILNVTCAAIP